MGFCYSKPSKDWCVFLWMVLTRCNLVIEVKLLNCVTKRTGKFCLAIIPFGSQVCYKFSKGAVWKFLNIDGHPILETGVVMNSQSMGSEKNLLRISHLGDGVSKNVQGMGSENSSDLITLSDNPLHAIAYLCQQYGLLYPSSYWILYACNADGAWLTSVRTFSAQNRR